MTDDVFPDRNMEHLDKLAWVIEDQGWVADPVDPVEGPPPQAGYTYSIDQNGTRKTLAHPKGLPGSDCWSIKGASCDS